MTGDSTRHHDPLEHADWDDLVERIEASEEWIVVRIDAWNSMCAESRRLSDTVRRLRQENRNLLKVITRMEVQHGNSQPY